MLIVYDIQGQTPVPWKLFLFPWAWFFRFGQKIFDELMFLTGKLPASFAEHLSLPLRIPRTTAPLAFFRRFHPSLLLSYNKMNIKTFDK